MTTICVINDLGLPLGGQTTIALATAEGMAARGYKVVYVCGAEQVTPMLAERGIRCIKLDQQELIRATDRKRAAINGIWNSRAHATIKSLIAELPPETVFHVHGWSRILSPSIFGALRPVMDRVVLTMHDHFSFCPNGGYFNFKTGQICTLKPLGVACALTDCDSRNRGFKVYRYVKHTAARALVGFPQTLRNYIVFSERQRELSRPFLNGNARFFVLENPVATAPAERIPAERNQDIVFIGRLSAEKGAEVYAKACALLGVRPLIVGDGERRAAVLAAAPDADISGWVDKEEVARRFARARAIVFPSVWPETFGLSMFEAVSRGIPALVSDAVLMKDKILELGGGMAFKSGDPADLARKMQALASDDAVRALSVTGFAKYREAPFTNSRYLDGLTDIYRALGSKLPERIAA
ncbi:Glycosyltransferase involved in cell wall bisynthesis [Arboricoccus pini]|uniref:Glycosyltransferase involved in cell wall bisynthesis n=1 Tax=Arboricoccus pini TaxID=1963835 RepID=A0A212RRE2_9PROT|nr:glycosyltransferase family 4 protein [Arboricoccus pini]SNB75137.1 Glycosyltransferase involved in cell wall bisynthesis [Arboricoccus pini]